MLTAASIGFFHTLLGPDHYLPFVMMSWARKWSAAKTLLITFVCAVGHIASSVVLGFVGVGFGTAVTTTTMLAAVHLGRLGVSFLPMKKIQRYSHAMAGGTILLCGVAIQFGL